MKSDINNIQTYNKANLKKLIPWKWTCTICNTTVRSKSNLENHILLVHPLESPESNTSAITESLCTELNAPRKLINVKLNTFDNSSNSKRYITKFKVTLEFVLHLIEFVARIDSNSYHCCFLKCFAWPPLCIAPTCIAPCRTSVAWSGATGASTTFRN